MEKVGFHVITFAVLMTHSLSSPAATARSARLSPALRSPPATRTRALRPGVQTRSFERTLRQVAAGDHLKVPANLQILLIPGLFTNHFAPVLGAALGDVRDRFKNELGASVHLAAEGEFGFSADNSVASNTAAIEKMVEHLYGKSNQPVVLMGQSSGAVWALETDRKCPALKGKIAAVVAVQSGYESGTPVAGIAYPLLKGPVKAIASLLGGKPKEHLNQALEAIHDVTPTFRRATNKEPPPLDSDTPILSITGNVLGTGTDLLIPTKSSLIPGTIKVTTNLTHLQGSYGKTSADLFEASLHQLLKNYPTLGDR